MARKAPLGGHNIARVKGRQLYDLLINALFNELRITAGGLAVNYRDCVAIYQVTTDQPLTMAALNDAQTFARGIVYAYTALT